MEFGFLHETIEAEWVAAPFVVPKAQLASFPLTIDPRHINAATKPITWPKYNIESELVDLRTSRYFSLIDFVSGYWQLPLVEMSQSLHTFMTTKACAIPIRTLQGERNSCSNFQSRVEPCLREMRHALKVWLYDFSVHDPTKERLLSELRCFLETYRERNLKISLPKSTFFTHTLQWYGGAIDTGGVRLDPRRLSGLAKVSKLITTAKLCEFMHCVTWMSPSIPEFFRTFGAPANLSLGSPQT